MNQTTYTPALIRSLNAGVQEVYYFDNGYGASVIQGPYSYGGPEGLWELGVIKFNDPNWQQTDGWRLTYTTPITDDVIGYQTEDMIVALLARIEKLDSNGREAE